MQKSRTCPICKTEWTGKDFVGERAAVDLKAKARERPSANGSAIRPKSPTGIEDEQSQEEEEEEEQEPE